MKKITFIAALFVAFTINAQTFTEGFDDVTTLAGDGWTFVNVSDDVENAIDPDFTQGGNPFGAFEGDDQSYLSVNFNSTAGVVIDNWAMLPTMAIIDGNTFTFYTRTVLGNKFPDALQVRISLDGDASVDPTPTDVGSYTTLALDINPDLTMGGYPQQWELQTVTITGVPTSTDARIAFRYYIPTDAGGANANFIGFDSVAFDSTLSTDEFNTTNFSQFYNVNTNELRLNASLAMDNIQVYNTLGQEVLNKSLSNNEEIVNLSTLSTGIYIARVAVGGTTETFKLIKR